MEYDHTNLPAAYDQGRDHGPEVLALWMEVVAAHVPDVSPERILDLGCGTGRFTAGLARRFDAMVIGVDPSRRMIRQAQQKPEPGDRVHFHLATAEALPLATGSMDLVFASMCFHHFADRRAAAAECRRVARPGAPLVVRTGTREQSARYPYTRFIPATHPILEQVLPDHAELRAPFEAAGLRLVATELIEQTIAPSWEAYADKLATGSDSVLARISHQEYADGLAAIRRHGAEVGPQPIIEEIDVLVFTA